jgi:hypothetical protein
MSDSQKKVIELKKYRKRADTELEMRWERIGQIAQEAREFANYCITRARRSDSSASSDSMGSSRKK